MKAWMIVIVVFTVVASGCSKKDNTSVASPSPGTTVQPSSGASATPSGTSTGTPGSTASTSATPKASSNGGTAVTPSKITKEQVEKISMTSTYDDLVKETGAKGQLVKEENGKQTYQFAISNQPGYYAEFVYNSNGKISEKRVIQK
ncbi:hypothetical protein A8709_03150 [Paenibacillus pectinilyticus]|uniref:Uncharacterized protein n=1 Tax=Paenibacillus pectinilyticus TaxID=512399 RepID=A0A1C1A795_9BACL|nr:hypothetical protein [Paenibacillus pectinilyticus]OCT16439.1 hypothetical protein A8709_03150 [Paenibacillus pectinilyticus]